MSSHAEERSRVASDIREISWFSDALRQSRAVVDATPQGSRPSSLRDRDLAEGPAARR